MNNKKRTINKQQKKGIRLWVQIIFAALTNGYVNGFIQSKIYTGPTKALCVPGLNCYSCPGALGACPIGSLQAVISSRSYQFSFYIIGFLMAVGALSGRVVCGFLCPFGLVQDLLHKIPVPKLKTLPGEKYLKYLKYVILAVFVLLLPMFAVNIIGQGNPWFCKWICPSGTLLGGIPLTMGNPDLQAAIGRLFDWKVFLMVSILVFSMFAYRPFCRFLCPLGAVYGVFNPVSLYHLHLDEDKCVNCGIRSPGDTKQYRMHPLRRLRPGLSRRSSYQRLWNRQKTGDGLFRLLRFLFQKLRWKIRFKKTIKTNN